MRRPLPLAWLIVLLFAYVYNISFLASPSVTTGRVALMLLLPLYAGSLAPAWRAVGPAQRAALLVVVLVLAYATLQLLLVSEGDTVQFSRLLHFLLYVLLGSALFAAASGYDTDRFARAFALTTAVQGALIFYSFVSPGFRLWLSQRLVQGGNIPFTTPLQAPGFSNSSGAALSLVQAVGMFTALLAARRAEGWPRRAIVLAGAIAGASTLVVGRTGLQLALLFALFFVFYAPPSRALRNLCILGAAGLALAAVSEGLLALLSTFVPTARDTVAWAFEFFLRGTGSGFFQEFFGRQDVPPLTLETLVGTGRVTAYDGAASASGHDSGYVQTYYALGLPMAVAFYLAVAAAFAEALGLARQDRGALAALVTAIFVVEVKEPFLFKYALPFLAFALLWLARSAAVTATGETVT
jgi:hypothetical protein